MNQSQLAVTNRKQFAGLQLLHFLFVVATVDTQSVARAMQTRKFVQNVNLDLNQ